MPELSILIKPCSGACNIDCKYCFYKALVKGDKHLSFIKKETMEQILKKSLDFADNNLYIAFQGGEPTLIGKEFYQEVHDYIKAHNHKNVKVHYALQTNGLIIDDEWCKMFKKYHYLIGLSLDGIEDIHNKYRKNYQQEGTYHKVIDTLKLFKKHQVNFNILTVVTNDLTSYAQKYFNNLKELGVNYIQLLECLDSLEKGPNSSLFSLKGDNYGRFLVELFDEWKKYLGSEHFVHINYFEDLLAILLRKCPNDCGMHGYCSSQYIFESNGDVYPCDFYVLDKYKLGNIFTDNFQKMKASKVATNFEEESFELEDECGECPYVKICRGGCRRAREHKGILKKTFLCESYYYFFTNRLGELIDIAKEVIKGKYQTKI